MPFQHSRQNNSKIERGERHAPSSWMRPGLAMPPDALYMANAGSGAGRCAQPHAESNMSKRLGRGGDMPSFYHSVLLQWPLAVGPIRSCLTCAVCAAACALLDWLATTPW